MATFKRCDRCAKESANTNFIGMELPPSGWLSLVVYNFTVEICDECYEAFKSWLGTKKVGDGATVERLP